MQTLANIDEQFAVSLDESGLQISASMRRRFLASLLTKRFVILTGLSGSGKTKLAQAIAQWLSSETTQLQPRSKFLLGETVAADRVMYHIDAVDSLSVQFSNQREDGRTIKVTLPLDLIDEWVEAIRSHNFTRDTRTRTIREAVAESTLYSTQLNSFETHLKAAAFHILAQSPSPIFTTLVENSLPTYAVVAVGADWHNSEPILGYPDALNPQLYVRTPVLDLILRASDNQSIPYFLIMDEMNLSHVERYFADILSAIESGEELHLYDSLNGSNMRDGVPASLAIPPNLFIVGTVNVDETTYLFSPKVLDRANSLEFRIDADTMGHFLEEASNIHLSRLHGHGHQFVAQILRAANESPQPLSDDARSVVNAELRSLFSLLSEYGMEFGFRSAYEIDRFIRIYAQIAPDTTTSEALDAQLYQKVLPRLNGSRALLDPVLSALETYCERSELDSTSARYPLTLQKIQRMRKLLRQNGFTSFAEA